MIRPGRLAAGIGKTDGLVELGRRAGLGEVDAYAPDLAALFGSLQALGPDANPEFGVAEAAGFVAQAVRYPAATRTLAPPHLCNERPASFPDPLGPGLSPAFAVAEIPGGVSVQLARAPVALLADRRTVIADYSSRYAPLLRFYDVDLAGIVDRAVTVEGAALVLYDDIFPLNYCHWMVDTLPRLAFLGARPDVSVVVSDRDAAFKRETLRACGIDESRVVWLPDFAAVRADTLLVSRDCRTMPHPAHKAAPWALDFLRSRVGLAALGTRPGSRKLYVSREDAGGRAVLNEDA